ncbi:hypothetical protein [Pseudoxanthomonas suwonensis]|uniref:Uncharacterized protein n=1 Tax=Pseudoxanthomonas suwonensis TaxID=314722 RepID=A0A0E3Z1Z7_9GAMM|nr:hypothetical protein [Pseudoxanthomonas suwonensis]AKC87044.1 hypothetical protein WQ53_10110 [Pseudoxanthomonas suwonensis]
MDNGQAPRRQAVVIDLDREREHWRQRYHALPRARAMRTFARYWPVLCAAYDVYLNHPRAPRDEAERLYLLREDVAASLLTEDEARAVFERAWARLEDAAGVVDAVDTA